eukprot:5638315-Pyramimonas_sp.AAC.1
MFVSECAPRQGESHILKTCRPQSVKVLQCVKKRTCAALRREPHLENQPPSIRDNRAIVFKRMCAALRREPHFENHPAGGTRHGLRAGGTRPQS